MSFLTLLGRDGLGGAGGSYFSTKFLGNMPSLLVPESSVYSPKYHSSSSSAVTVMIWPIGKLRSSSWVEEYSKTALTVNGVMDIWQSGMWTMAREGLRAVHEGQQGR